MKFRESGMPSEDLWKTFFDPMDTLKKMGVCREIRTLIDIGCGYGTFLLPAASLIDGKVIGIDIDKEMVEICKANVFNNNITNIDLIHGDITAGAIKGLEKYRGQIDYITLFNLLHCEEPLILLNIVFDILSPGGRLGVIHWKPENTPRGPSKGIRPKPEAIVDWAVKAGFELKRQLELAPYHFGLVFIK